jgi:hypothetical protein
MNAADLHLPRDLGMRPNLGVHHGESDPAAMLCRVLLLLLSIIALTAALGLVWWLA